jgi:adenylosuccinate synthase
MPVDVLLGLQWGDEGKGKIVDVFGSQYAIVARYQGGPNAGHTLVINGQKLILHQVPSGVFHPDAVCLIGNGVVLNPHTLQVELQRVADAGLEVRHRLLISRRAHLIVPTHRLIDQAHEAWRGGQKVGSTLRGISPTYRDKVGREGLRVGDVLLPDFESRYNRLKEYHQALLAGFGAEQTVPDPAEEREFFDAIEALRQLQLVDTENYLFDALQAGKQVLAEGAQGTLLDIDFGSYPYVTGSNTITAGACAGLGIPPKAIRRVFGVFKAYCTRVGSGPFPTELHGEAGEALRTKGGEFGATTGRPRRCGWLDLPLLRYAIRLNGVTDLVMTKADVLSDHNAIQVCTHYDVDGIPRRLPTLTADDHVKPVWHSHPAWGPLSVDAPLPQELQDYLGLLKTELGQAVPYVSIGPGREAFLEVGRG